MEACAPAIWQSFRMPGNLAEFHPGISQIWVFQDRIQSKLDETATLTHEYLHVYSASFQAAYMLAIRAELLGYCDRPDHNCFEDIVETVAELLLWVIHRFDETDLTSCLKASHFPHLFREIVGIARQWASVAHNSLSPLERLKECVGGICLLLMHLVPQKPASGRQICAVLSELPAPDHWLNRSDVFALLYPKLNVKWKTNQHLEDLFVPTLKNDHHRFVSDLITFLGASIQVMYRRHTAVIKTFPALLALLSQGSFVMIPMIYLRNLESKPQAVLRIIHPTSRTSRRPDMIEVRLVG